MKGSPRWLAASVALWLGACACEGSSDGDAGRSLPDGSTSADASRSDASTVIPIPGEGECAWEPGARPVAAPPAASSRSYTLELGRWEIANDRGDPVETRARINEALQWALDDGYDEVHIPAGTYLVGEPTNDIYAAGIEIPGSMTLVLEEGAVLEMATNDRHNYCVISLEGHDDVTIRGGEILGDRATHMFVGGTAHDEGHGICAWTGVHRVRIEGMNLHELTGDGILIVGGRGTDDTPEDPSTDITIVGNEIHHNRRQGVSVVGAHRVVIEDNHIHHIEGTSPEFGIDIEGAGRSDEDILIYRNRFDHNAGGDVVTSSGRNTWIEENVMIQCQVDGDGNFDPSLPCDLERQVDGPIIHWQETSNVILNNEIRMTLPTVNGRWAILGYTRNDGPIRDNPIGNYIAGNTLFDAGIHMANNQRYFVSNNTIHEGLILGYRLGCTRLEDNRINRTAREHYKLRNVAGTARGNILNREAGAPASADVVMHFPMADDAPYRNSSPVFW